MSFAAPLLLAALLALPLLWWLLRATPPAARREAFGGMVFLRGLRDERAEPARTPWPVLLLRLLAAALLIVGLAGPALGVPEGGRTGPLLIVLDDGWPSAPGWRDRQDAVRREADRPGADERQAWLLRTASDTEVMGPLTMTEAARLVTDAVPVPRLPDYDGAADALRGADIDADVLWLPGASVPDTRSRTRLVRAMAATGDLEVLRRPGAQSLAVTGLRSEGANLVATIARAGAAPGAAREATATVRVHARDGRTLTDVAVPFAAGADAAEAEIALPLSLRNEAARLSLTGQRSAGATWLIDASARRVRAGLVSESETGSLLTSNTYLTEALAPLALIERGGPAELAQAGTDVIVLDDVGTLRADDQDALEVWTRAGGLLLRFAGPDTANATDTANDTFPAPMRGGGRSFGGALTWETPQPLAGFTSEGPLAGLAVPEGVAVRRQVLSQQGADAQVWAYLADGTPLVTARAVGEGLVVLVHVTASPTWSDLPLAGVFPAMLRRVLTMAGTSALGERQDGPLAPLALMDGYGALAEPATDAPPATPDAIAEGALAPGFYGAPDAPLAINAYDGTPALAAPAKGLPPGVRVTGFEGAAARRLGPPLVATALLLLALDALLVAALSRSRAPAAAAAGLAFLLPQIMTGQADAQPRPPLDPQAIEAAETTRFAYVETGDASQDRISRAGLSGLTRETIRRSALEPGEPVGIDPARDELSVYPLIYWPIAAGQDIADEALFALEDYMNGGGLLVIDTMDGERAGGSSAQQDRLRGLLRRMDTPPLEPMTDSHVLTLSFYRLDDLHGRNSGGPVWVEAGGALRETTDGVPTLVIGGRDWASAWAVDETGIPLRSPGPGGERRREYAYRSGVNLAMVALTGSYKTDQVHVSEFLRRLDDERGGGDGSGGGE